MKKILMLLLVVILSISSVVGVISPVKAEAQSSPPQSPEAAWQPPDEGGEMAPPVTVEKYGQTWSNLNVQQPMSVAPGMSGAIVDAYLVNGYGQLLSTLHPGEVCYLVVSFNGPGYFYLWEYYPPTTTPYGHWLCYRWYRPYAGVWKIGPFAAESFDPSGRYVWKLWFLSGSSWSTRTLSFNYFRSYYPPDIPGIIIPAPIPSPVINSFSANKSSIETGETAVLTWNTTNAINVTISPGVGAVATSGSTTVTPTATTIYTLTASGKSGNPASSTTTITVMPRILPTISASQDTIQRGQATSLSWNAPGAIRVYITGIGDAGVKGTIEVAPDKTAIYALTATYVDGTTQSTSVTVNVEQPPYLLWGLIALLAAAAIVIVVLLLRRPATARQAPLAATQGGYTAPAETLPTDTLPATTPVTETASAKLAMPDGSEIFLAGNARSFGRHDFEKSMPPDNVSYISRQQFNIWYEDDHYYIEDRSSTNGTRVNGADIKGTGRHMLADGDVIELSGKLSINFKG